MTGYGLRFTGRPDPLRSEGQGVSASGDISDGGNPLTCVSRWCLIRDMTTLTAPAAATFQVGATYSCRSIGDHNCVWTFTVTKRSARFVTLVADDGETRRVGVRVFDGSEAVSPLGSYSMAPVLRADRPVA